MELPSIDEALQEILLNVKIVVADGRELVSELGEVFNGFFNPIGEFDAILMMFAGGVRP
jgi:hypothetical protein